MEFLPFDLELFSSSEIYEFSSEFCDFCEFDFVFGELYWVFSFEIKFRSSEEFFPSITFDALKFVISTYFSSFLLDFYTLFNYFPAFSVSDPELKFNPSRKICFLFDFNFSSNYILF